MAYAQTIIIDLYGQISGQTEMRKTMEQIMMGKSDMLTDVQKDRFEQDVNQFISDLEFSFRLQAIAYTLPLSVLQKYIYTVLTKESYHWTAINLMNIMIAASYTWTLVRFEAQKGAENMGFGIRKEPTMELQFMEAMMEDIQDNVVNIALLLSIIAGLTWFRILIALQVTEEFGPLVTAMFKMIIDIIQFLFIFIVQLFAFAIISSMAFF